MKKTLIHSIIRAIGINNRKARHIFHARFHTQHKDTIFCRIKTAFICTPSMHVKAETKSKESGAIPNSLP